MQCGMKSRFFFISLLLLLCGCGKQEETTETVPVTTEAGTAASTEASVTTGAGRIFNLKNMTYSVSDVWAGEGIEKNGNVQFNLKESMLIISVMEDSGDPTNPDVQAQYRDGLSANYDANMTLVDCGPIGGRPAFGVTGDFMMSDESYCLYLYVVRSNNNWYIIQFFQKDGEDHQKELKDFLAGISFGEEVMTYKTCTAGYLEYTVPSGWRGDGVLNDNGAAYFYPDYGMLMVEERDFSSDLSSAAVQSELINDFNGDMESGGIELTNSFVTDDFYYSMTAAGECVISGKRMQISALYIQAGDKLYNLSMGAFEGHFTDYDTETDRIFSSVRILDRPSVTTEEQTGQEAGSGIRADFKKTMDDYEEYFDKYIEYIVKFQEAYDPNMQAEYEKFIEGYEDVMKKVQGLDISELSPEENAYYQEVMNRINEKLANATGTP